MKLKVFDFIAVAAAAAVTVVSAVSVYAGGSAELRLVVEGGGRIWHFPLDAEETVHVHGAIGDTVVRVSRGDAWIESSPCENQICVASGHIHRAGDWVACLPNVVFIRIEGIPTDDAPDATSR
jgi:hypothetical protein